MACRGRDARCELLLRARRLRAEAYKNVPPFPIRTTYLHSADAYRTAARLLRGCC